MIKLLAKHKKSILISLGLIILVAIIWVWLSKDKIAQVDVPSDDPNQLPSETEITNANQIARALFTVMDGFNINPWGKDMEAYKALVSASDKVFVLAYNRFNELYGMAGKGTLRDWMKDEGYIKEDEDFVYNVIFPRMDRLNLK